MLCSKVEEEEFVEAKLTKIKRGAMWYECDRAREQRDEDVTVLSIKKNLKSPKITFFKGFLGKLAKF